MLVALRDDKGVNIDPDPIVKPRFAAAAEAAAAEAARQEELKKAEAEGRVVAPGVMHTLRPITVAFMVPFRAFFPKSTSWWAMFVCDLRWFLSFSRRSPSALQSIRCSFANIRTLPRPPKMTNGACSARSLCRSRGDRCI